MFSNIGMELGVTSAIGWGRKVVSTKTAVAVSQVRIADNNVGTGIT